MVTRMTVSYSGDVGNASVFGCFNKILGRWRGSVYKLVFKELLAYISLYLVINLTYRLVLVRNSSCDIEFQSCVRWKQYRETFESLRGYCYENVKSIPLMFVLGFYVSLVVTRYVYKQFSRMNILLDVEVVGPVQPPSLARLICPNVCWDVQSEWG